MTIPLLGPTLEERLDLAFEVSKAGVTVAENSRDANALIAAAYDLLRAVLAGTMTLDDNVAFADDLDRLAVHAREVAHQRHTDDLALAQRLNGSRRT